MDDMWSWMGVHLPAALTWIALIGDIVLRLTAIVIVPRGRRPGSAIAWLLTIMIFPWVGFPLFLMLGSNKLPRGRWEKHREVDELMRARAEALPDAVLDPDAPSWLQSAVQLNRNLGAFPLTGDNAVELDTDYGRTIERMTADVRAAESTVHALFYTMGLDDVTRDFVDALCDAADRGVAVRVLYDFYGSASHPREYRALRRTLTAHGIAHHAMLPIRPLRNGAFQRPDLRNHRKLLIVDGETGWMGSQNMIARHYDKRANIRRGLRWQETMARLRGPIVSEMNLLFAIDWYFESDETLPEGQVVRPAPPTGGALECQLVPSGPGFPSQNNLLLFNQLFYSAKERIVAVSPYFVPDESMLGALVTAAKRGVDVEVMVSEIGDQFLVHHAQRSYYRALLEAGVRIQLYRSPFILHAKHVSIDDSVAVIGSSNMDMRSFWLQMECSLMVGDSGFLRQVHELEDMYRRRCRELTMDEWRERSQISRAVDDLCRLASAVV